MRATIVQRKNFDVVVKIRDENAHTPPVYAIVLHDDLDTDGVLHTWIYASDKAIAKLETIYRAPITGDLPASGIWTLADETLECVCLKIKAHQKYGDAHVFDCEQLETIM